MGVLGRAATTSGSARWRRPGRSDGVLAVAAPGTERWGTRASSDDAGLGPVAAPGTERTEVSDGDRQWAAVVVNYEAGPLLLACVESLLADNSAGAPEIVVVDNGSRDGSVAALHRARPAVRVLDPGTNLGYAAAANRGIAASSAPVVAVCNPDLEVCPGTAAAMVARFAAEPDLAAVGPALLNPDGTQYPSARAHASSVDAVGHAALGARVAGQPLHASLPSARCRLAAGSRRRLGVGRDRVPPACRGRFRRRLGRGLLHVHGGRRSVLAAPTTRLARRLRTGGQRGARPGGQHRGPALPHDHRAPPIGVPVRRPPLAGHPPVEAPPPRRCSSGSGPRSTSRLVPCARAPKPRGSAGNLRLAMPQSRTRYQRAAMRSKYRKPKRRRGGSFGWNVAIAALIIVGVVSVFLVRGGGNSAGSGPPARLMRPRTSPVITGTPPSTSTSVANGSVRRPRSRSPTTARTRSPTPGSTRTPTVSSTPTRTWPLKRATTRPSASSSATADGASRPIRLISEARTPPIRSGRARSPRPSRRRGATATSARSASTRARRSNSRGPSTARQQTGNPADYHQQDGETVAIYMLPKGAEMPFPTEACTAFNKISDQQSAILSKKSPCRAIDATTTTTAPGATTTTAPAASTTSTP